MDKGTRQVKSWLRWQREINALLEMAGMKFRETDTVISALDTVSKDINLAEFMHKIGGVYDAQE